MQAAYQKVIGNHWNRFEGRSLPVETVSWREAVRYCAAVAVGGRLPTEAEWEYAARAGSTAARYRAFGAIAWHSGNSGGRTREVRGKQGNDFGLYDMLGNVWEWTADWYGPYQGAETRDPRGPGLGKLRVLRGGSWYDFPTDARASNRHKLDEQGRGGYVGFRCVGEIP
jgi:formylglycine-generating enzyme required for sulfatase activity